MRRRRLLLPLALSFALLASGFAPLAGSGPGFTMGLPEARAEKGKKVKNAFKRFGQAVKKGAKATAGALKGKGKSGGAKK